MGFVKVLIFLVAGWEIDEVLMGLLPLPKKVKSFEFFFFVLF